MKAGKNQHQVMRSYLFCLVVLYLSGPADAATEFDSRALLLGRLDSIELVKQERRRAGLSLEAQEKVSMALKDSIQAYNARIAAMPPEVRTQRASPDHHRMASLEGALPNSMFDWVIVIIGAIALLCGVILLFGIVRALGSSGKKRRKEIKTLSDKFNVTAPRILDQPAPVSNVPHPETGPRIETPQSANNSKVDDLRSRINQLEKAALPTKPLQPKQSIPLQPKQSIPLQPRQTPSLASPRAGQGNGMVIALVLQESQKGMSPAEISRKHRISIDQINLVLRTVQDR